jgi:hypothetical protein
VGACKRHFIDALKHFTSEVTKQKLFATEATTFHGKLRITDMEGRLRVKIAALADKQIRPLRVLH